VSQHWAQQVTDLLPDGALARIPDAPHTVNYSAAPELLRVVAPFLDQQQQDTTAEAAVTEEYSPRWSLTRRTARAFSSSSIFLGMVLILLDSTGAASNLGRFSLPAARTNADRTPNRVPALRGSRHSELSLATSDCVTCLGLTLRWWWFTLTGQAPR